MSSVELTDRMPEAVVYAFELHRRQRRRGSGRPYVAHLLGVAALVLEHGGVEDQAIAALLHDALEDQGDRTSAEEIGQRFGPRVRRIVEACSDSTTRPRPPWHGRKRSYLERLAGADPDTLLVSLADKLYNARTIADDRLLVGERVWDRFGAGRDDQLWYYRSLADLFAARLPGVMAGELDRVVSDLERGGPVRPG